MNEQVESEIVVTENTNPVEETQDNKTVTESASTEEIEETEEDETSADESETSEENENENEDENKEEKPKKNGFKKRIDRLNRKISDHQKEVEYWKQEALKGKDQPKDVKETAKPIQEGKPKADDFESQEDYIDALTEWKLDQKIKAQDENRKRDETAKTQKEFADKWQGKVKSFKEKTPDFEDIMEDAEDVAFLPVIQEAIFDSDLGPELLYELAKNPEEAKRIGQLSDIAAVREIGKIEARLQSSNKTTTKKQTTNAPAPITKTVKGTAKISKDLNDPELSQSEYEALRAKQMSKSSKG